jgi:hypothetical protein
MLVQPSDQRFRAIRRLAGRRVLTIRSRDALLVRLSAGKKAMLDGMEVRRDQEDLD